MSATKDKRSYLYISFAFYETKCSTNECNVKVPSAHLQHPKIAYFKPLPSDVNFRCFKPSSPLMCISFLEFFFMFSMVFLLIFPIHIKTQRKLTYASTKSYKDMKRIYSYTIYTRLRKKIIVSGL